MTRVLLADDDLPIRAGVRAVLEDGGFVVCAEATDASGAVEAAVRERPDICLLGVHMPGNGIDAAAEIYRRLPETAIVMLAGSLDERDVIAAIRAGASGYLLKDMNTARLAAALRGVLKGEAAMPRTLTGQLLEQFRTGRDRRRLPRLGQRGEVLTGRERDVLELLADRSSSDEIARRLGISPVTVRRHISEILRKLDVPDREAAVRLVDTAREE
jgi:DNA-binding NarL/FixJ family response regulator